TAVKDGHFDEEKALAAYADAFREYGLGPDTIDPREAGERIQARPIHRQLVAALDHWSLAGRKAAGSGPKWASAAAQAADRDEWRNRLRDAWGRQDSKAVDELLSSAPAEGWPSVISIRPREGAAGKWLINQLRRAQERRPDDFWSNHELALYLQSSRPPRWEEAVRYYSIAVSLRPRSPGARLNLGKPLSA